MKGFETYNKRRVTRTAYLCAQITKTYLMSIKKYVFASAVCFVSLQANAQLSTNPDKFLGNITTGWPGSMDTDGLTYWKLWNQVTPENASKWETVQGTRSNYSWGTVDNTFNYAKNHNFTYKFHAFLWGSQYPKWLESLSIKERFEAIETWYDAIRSHYSTLPLVDVVNEAVGNHQPGNAMMKASVGGGGKTGYDWLIKAFEMAFERFPNSILIYNDYNSLRYDVDNYIALVKALRDAGAPIDAYGNQAHELKGCSTSELSNVMKKQQDALKMPMYMTEYDISSTDDNEQLKYYKEQIPLMWQADYCAGITLWGFIYGKTWTDEGKGYSGIYKNGKERLAMTWLRDYMASDNAKNAKSPLPGMKKRMGVYIKPADFKVAKGDVVPIKVRTYITDDARKEKPDMRIEKVELYTGTTIANATTLVATMTEAPYICNYTAPSTTGYKVLKAVVTTQDTTFVRYGGITVLGSTVKREPYNGTPAAIPGTINVAEFDKGASGVTYSNAPYNYNSRAVTKAIADNAWMEYTVDVKEDGLYKLEAEVAATKAGGTFHLTEYGLDSLTFLANMIEVPATGSTTNYKTISTICKNPISAGKHHLCLNVDKGDFYIKSLTFKPYTQNKDIKVAISSLSRTSINEGETVTINLSASVANGTISSVVVYANDEPIDTLTEAPYTTEFAPASKGTYVIKAVAYDANGAENASSTKTLTVKAQRVSYKGVISIPGIIEIEDFDKGGEGLSFHDSDTNDEGDANYRNDNEGVDLVKGNGGIALGYTAKDEWLEYSVNVEETGYYTCVATASSGTTGSGFVITTKKNSSTTSLWTISIPQTGNNSWSTYEKVENNTKKRLTAGQQIIRVKITGASCNIDKIEIKSVPTGIDEVAPSTVNLPPSTFNLSGQKVDGGYRGIVIRNGRKVLKR